MTETMQPQYYLRGNRKFLFWAIIGFIAFLLVTDFASFVVPGDIQISVGLIPLILYNTGWAAFLLIYGKKSIIKPFRWIFYILALTQLLGTLKDYKAYFSYFMGDGRACLYSSRILTIIYSIIWTIGLCIILFNRNTGIALRAVSIPFAAFFILSILNNVSQTSIYPWLWPSVGKYIASSIEDAVFALISVFFFGALSFTKMKPPKASSAAAIPDIDNI